VVRKRRLRRGSAARSHFPAPLRRLAFLHRSLHRSGKDERTVTTACLQPDVTNGLQGPTSFKGQTRAHLILARRDDLHLKAEYICADLSSRPNFSLQSRGGPYIRNELVPARNADPDNQRLLRGLRPPARKGIPRLPRFACAALRCASPFPLRIRSVTRVGDPLPLHLLPPAFATWRSAFELNAHYYPSKKENTHDTYKY
jgi:hypothetical protein